MNTLIRLLQLKFLPASADLGLLALRLWLGGSLLVLHGWSKVLNYSKLASTFPDPLGVGSRWSLVLAILGEVLCTVLIMIGFFTRLAALGSAVTMAVAWYLVHKMALSGPASGELAFIYLAGFVTLIIAGAGRFSVDAGTGGNTSRIKPQPPRK